MQKKIFMNNNILKTKRLPIGLMVVLTSLFIISDFFGVIIAFLQVSIAGTLLNPLIVGTIGVVASVNTVLETFGVGFFETKDLFTGIALLVTIQIFLSFATVIIFIILGIAKGKGHISKIDIILSTFIGVIKCIPVVCAIPIWSWFVRYITGRSIGKKQIKR